MLTEVLRTSNLEAVGSSPTSGVFFEGFFADSFGSKKMIEIIEEGSSRGFIMENYAGYDYVRHRVCLI